MAARRLHRLPLGKKTDGTLESLLQRRIELGVVSFHIPGSWSALARRVRTEGERGRGKVEANRRKRKLCRQRAAGRGLAPLNKLSDPDRNGAKSHNNRTPAPTTNSRVGKSELGAGERSKQGAEVKV